MDLETLHKIDEELTKSEVAALKFLCKDFISNKRLETVTDGKDLFLRLHEQDVFKDELFLPELLHTIGRNDLLGILDTNPEELSKLIEEQRGSRKGISLYRKMLYKVSENLTSQNLCTVKFLLDYLPKSKRDSFATFLDVLTAMEKMDKLGENNRNELVNVLDKCDKQLANTVREFKSMQSVREQEPESIDPIPSNPQEEEETELSNVSNSIPPLSISEGRDTRSNSVVADAEAVSATERPQQDEFYSMTRKPRGICLIVNNHDFKNACPPLPDRTGTAKDAEEIRRLFTKLHFMVEEKNDLSGAHMQNALKKYALKDHSQMDSFICFILSHGGLGTVHGVDGEDVKIQNLVEHFSYCSTLVGKPKLFFIQACQGNNYQRSAFIQADGKEDGELEEDANRVEFNSIPIRADILIGMSTMESFKSFRHINLGSIYIQELCQQINIGLESKEDLLSILTRVNRKVSSRMLLGHKQMPEPRYTLTKKVVFTLH